MKNFRKVLALVLVVATLLSFATMASADYKDQADIAAEYEVAVDILTGLGILNGEKKGDDVVFRPADEIDRDEVAKMVAVLCNGGKDIEAYYADACTFADTKNTWAAGYVAYCYHTGIVDGRTATTFDPDASITGYEVAKMLLCVMGFDADEQGYVGKDWKVNVLRDARNFGLLDNLGKSFALKNNIKRQEVAQMMINVLGAPIVVGTISENIISISNAAYLDLGIGLKDIELGKYAILYGNVVVNVWQQVGEMFGIYTIDVFNNYGRPFQRWGATWNGWFKDYAYTGTKSTTGSSELTADNVFIDGEWVGSYSKVAKSGKGLIVETYKTNKSGTVAVVLNTDVAKVESTYKALGTNYYTYSLDEYASQTVSQPVKNTVPYAVGDVLLVRYNNSKVTKNLDLTAYKAAGYAAAATYTEVTPVKATITRTIHNPSNYYGAWTQANSSFVATVDNKGYHYNNWFKDVHDRAGGEIFDTNSIGKEYALYFDENGYVVYWDLWANVNPTVYEYDYAYFVEGTWKDVFGNVVTESGVEVKHYNDFVDFTAKYLDDVQVAAADCGEYDGQLVKYTTIGGVVNVVAEAHNGHIAEFDTATGDIDVMTFAHEEIDQIVHLEVTTTSATKFLVRTWNTAKQAYEYEAFTGYKAVAAKYPGVIFAAESGRPASIQYFTAANNPLKAEYVFIDAAAVAVQSRFFLIGWEETWSDIQVNVDIENFEVYKVLVGTEIAYLLIDTPDVEGFQLPAGLYDGAIEYIGASVDGKPVYAAAEPADNLEMVAGELRFDEIADNKLFYYVAGYLEDGTVLEVKDSAILADNYSIFVVDYKSITDAGYGEYVKITEYKDADKFNSEVVEDIGYVLHNRFWVELNNDGEVIAIYVVRVPA